MLSESLTNESSPFILAAMDDFLDYLKKRRAALRKELVELDAAERLYLQSGASTGEPSLLFELPEKAKKPTIKEGVVQLLREVSPGGLTALEILDRLNRRWWRGELKRTSLSPQITRLKNDKKVVSERGVWKLANEDASPVSSGEAS